MEIEVLYSEPQRLKKDILNFVKNNSIPWDRILKIQQVSYTEEKQEIITIYKENYENK